MQTAMKANRTVELLSRLPRWFAEQARAADPQTRQSLMDWEEACRRDDATDRRAALEFLCAVEVKDSEWAEWEDTVADFNAR